MCTPKVEKKVLMRCIRAQNVEITFAVVSTDNDINF